MVFKAFCVSKRDQSTFTNKFKKDLIPLKVYMHSELFQKKKKKKKKKSGQKILQIFKMSAGKAKLTKP